MEAISFEWVDKNPPDNFGYRPSVIGNAASPDDFRRALDSYAWVGHYRTIPTAVTEKWGFRLDVPDREWASKARMIRAVVRLTTGKTVKSNPRMVRAAFADEKGLHHIAP